MNRLIPLLAWRYIHGSLHEKNITLMAKICFGTIALSTFCLTLIVCIMQGFERVTYQKLRGMHAHIIIRSYGDILNAPFIMKLLQHEFPEIRAMSPSNTQQAIIQTDSVHDITNIIALKGIDPFLEQKMGSLEQAIHHALYPEKTLSALLDKNGIIIGSELAKMLNIQVGETITLFVANEDEIQRNSVSFNKYQCLVTGLFTSGIEEFDTNLGFCSLETMKTIWPDSGITQLNVQLRDGIDEDTMAQKLKDRLGIQVASWKSLYPALVAALTLEKYALFFILGLIILIACTNIIALEYMHIMYRRTDIGILKAMGMPQHMIQQLFMLVGLIITGLSTIIGLLGAFFSALLLQRYPFIKLPDSYYATHLPIAIEWYFFVIIFFAIMILNIIALWIATRRIKTISLVQLLRSEV